MILSSGNTNIIIFEYYHITLDSRSIGNRKMNPGVTRQETEYKIRLSIEKNIDSKWQYFYFF